MSLPASIGAGWESLSALVQTEFKQCEEEGKDLQSLQRLRSEFESARGDRSVLEALHQKLLELPVTGNYEEPSDLEGIRFLSTGSESFPAIDLSPEALEDKHHGAWLGRCIGCALGKPVELMMDKKDGLESWQRQKRYLTAISPDEWPLSDFFPASSPASAEVGHAICPLSTRETIAFMESDDDIRYTVIGQIVMNEKGIDFTTADVARQWLLRLGYRQVCTAETQAYRNLVTLGNFHLESAEQWDWEWVATHLNPYREWIGAQIRIDSYGYAAAGNTTLAAEFAWRDARLSHVKNGIYGAMFCAAMIAAAFSTANVRKIIEAGLGQIPTTSRLHQDIRQTIAVCDKYECQRNHFESIIAEVYLFLGHYSPIHTNNNAALCVVALLLSQGDFHHGVTLAVMGGLDTDCNGATVGSIVGAISGATRIPPHWSRRLNNTLDSEICGYHPIAISECAQRSVVIATNLRKQQMSETI